MRPSMTTTTPRLRDSLADRLRSASVVPGLVILPNVGISIADADVAMDAAPHPHPIRLARNQHDSAEVVGIDAFVGRDRVENQVR